MKKYLHTARKNSPDVIMSLSHVPVMSRERHATIHIFFKTLLFSYKQIYGHFQGRISRIFLKGQEIPTRCQLWIFCLQTAPGKYTTMISPQMNTFSYNTSCVRFSFIFIYQHPEIDAAQVVLKWIRNTLLNTQNHFSLLITILYCVYTILINANYRNK